MNGVRDRGVRIERRKRVGRHEVLSRRAFWTLIGLVAAIYLPVLAIVMVTTEKAGPDLSDLTPVVGRSDRYAVLAWPELERGRHALRTGAISSGALIRALGYMMDGDRPLRNGQHVQSFILLPDAGNAVHPAHRFGDQMIEVRLETGSPVRFSERSLVWVWGTLQMLPGDPLGHVPLYVLEHARTEPATNADIRKYLK
jgi:hypothetical protein